MVIVIANFKGESAQNQNIGQEKFQNSMRVSSTLKLLLIKNVLFYISAVETTYLHHMAVTSIKLCQLNRYRVEFPYCLICLSVYSWMWPFLLNVSDFRLSSSESHLSIFLPLDSWLLPVVLQENLSNPLLDQPPSTFLLSSHKYCWI